MRKVSTGKKLIENVQRTYRCDIKSTIFMCSINLRNIIENPDNLRNKLFMQLKDKNVGKIAITQNTPEANEITER